MGRTQRLLAALLVSVLLLCCFCAALAEGETPAPAKETYTVDGITYYDVNIQDPQRLETPGYFLTDMMGTKSTELYAVSMVDQWLTLGLGCYLGQYGSDVSPTKDYENDMYYGANYALLHPGEKCEELMSETRYGTTSFATKPQFGSSVKQAFEKIKNVPDCPAEDFPGLLDLKKLTDFDKEQYVVASYVYAENNYAGSIGAMVFFTDFEAVALLPDDSDSTSPNNYVTKKIHESPTTDRTYASNVKNLTLSPITASQSVTNGWSTTVTSTTSGSDTYSFSESIQLGWAYKFVVAKISANLGFTATQAFQKGWSESTASTDQGSITESVTVALPPYTSVLMEQGSSETEYETKFNCPIGLKYKVRLFAFRKQAGNKDFDHKAWTFGPDARANLYKRAIRDGQLEIETDGDASNQAINWKKALPYAYEDWTVKGVAETITSHVPMSPRGSTFEETLNTNYTTVKGIVPVEDLALTKLVAPSNVSFITGDEFSYDKINYLHADMKVGDSSSTGLLTVKGLNADGADYYGFYQRWGSWKVEDKDGNELTGEDAPVVLDSDTSAVTKYTAQRPGTCYLRYYINQESYPRLNAVSGGFDADGEYITNGDLKGRATLEITVAKEPASVVEPPKANQLTYNGEDQALVSPGTAEGGKMVYALDENGSYSDEIPQAQEAGSYRVWYKAQGDESHTDSEAGYTNVTILKAPVEPVQPASDALVYNGKAKALVIPGTVEGGTIQYFVGNSAPADEGSWSASVPSGINAGNYTVWYRVKGDANHKDVAPASLVVTIERKPLLVTAKAAEKTYGNADPRFTYIAEGLVGADTLTGSLSRVQGENVGTYAITQGTLAASGNYTLYYNEGLLTITPRALTVRAMDATAVYGEADPALEYIAEGLLAGDALSGRLTRGAGVDVGTYPITRGSLSASGNYTMSFVNAVFTIVKRPLSVRAEDVSKSYGEADPTLTYTADGLVGADTLTGRLSRVQGENVGTYAITQGTLKASGNYALYYNEGLMTITPRALTVRATNATAIYGESDPALGYIAEGLLAGDALTGALTREPGKNVGDYPITQGSLTAPDNYTMSFENAVFTIVKRPLSVRAENVSKSYGEADPTLTYTADGLVGGDSLTGALTREPGEAVGSYAITQGTLKASTNYDVSFTGATLTIDALSVKSDFTLLARATSYGKNGIKFSWTPVDGAQGYDIFFKRCDGDERYPLYRTARGTSTKLKGLKKGKCYKGYVQAWRRENGEKVYIGEPSPVVHCIPGKYNSTTTIAKSIRLNASSVSVERGQSFALKATIKKVKAKRKLINHERSVRYLSSDANVAMVNAKGVVTGVSEGSCMIYAITPDGVRTSVAVTVN